MLVIKKHRVHRALFEFKGHREIVSPKGVHAFMSHDRNYVVSDVSVGGWWHGCAWQVYFHSR